MTTILLGNLGGVVGGLFGPVGALIGRAAGALAGAAIDSAIVSAITPAKRVTGPRLTTSDIQTSTEGSGITRLYGRARTVGQIIWATRLQEVVTTERTGGKGAQPKVETTTFSYLGNFAIGLCEGPISGIGRIWADGKELDLTQIEYRLYHGSADQMPDPLIEAKEGTPPAYRNLAYLVFEALALGDYGNRLPQISVEVYRPVGRMETLIEGVALIPGNEYGLADVEVKDSEGTSQNRHTLTAATDMIASVDRLTALCPNLASVMLVVSWFGDDLRCGHATIRPKVETTGKRTDPLEWSVAGLTRDTAEAVSIVDGIPAYGGTPSDETVIQAIRHLTERGIAVTYCPFIMMDIPPGNGLPDPYGETEQARLPWRGRITCDPAPGRPGTPDKTAVAGAQLASFLGTAAASDFSIDGDDINYDGPDEWGFRRFILHNAALATAAGVQSFLIGSEMAALSTVRAGPRAYPFVDALMALAAESRSLLGGGVAIGYAADWSEWLNHRPADGSGDVLFHLDPLWANGNIDFIGLDAYFPLADWRDGSEHLDFHPTGPLTTYDRAYLQANIEGGEDFDWFYADTAARIAQLRSPIIDGSGAAEPWIFRNKDVRSWWSLPHHDRPGGIRQASATAWVPKSKPIRLIEFGCAAVDKGANQPNVFPDGRSAEGAYPYFSNFARDDGMQRAYLEALLDHWGNPAINPVSPLYGGRMLDLSKSHVWCWDTRPWPSYPVDSRWGDAPNWQSGHWLSGRLGAAPATETIRAILDAAQFTPYAIDPLPYVVDGVTANGVDTPRATLDALRPVFGFNAVESDGLIKFRDRHATASLAVIGRSGIVAGDDQAADWRRTRAQETELPATVKIGYGDPVRDDQAATAEARRTTSISLVTSSLSPPVIMAESRAREVAEIELATAWTAREQITATLAPSRIAYDVGDVLTFQPTGRLVRLTSTDDSDSRAINAEEVDPILSATVLSTVLKAPAIVRARVLPAELTLVDGPLLSDSDQDHAGYIAASMSPFRSGVAAWRSPGDSGYVRDTILGLPCTTGRTLWPLYAGPVWRFDRVNSFAVRLGRGTLTSTTQAALFDSANPLLVENADGEWELLQFLEAELIAPMTYALSGLLRGQKGTEHAMRNPVETGARVLFIDASLRQTALTPAQIGLPLNWRGGAADRDISAAGPPINFTMRGKGRRPLSPVQLRAKLSGTDLVLSWIRRGRLSADSWDQADIPLGEEVEAYQVEIVSGATVVRSFATAVPNVTYTAAAQAADGVSVPFDFIVYQMSATYGRSIAARSTYYG